MACEFSVIPNLACCPTSPRQRFSDTIILRTVAFGFAGKLTFPAPYQAFSKCKIEYKITGARFNDPAHPLTGSKTVNLSITLDQDPYVDGYTSEVTTDADWDLNASWVIGNYSGARDSEEVISPTNWVTHFGWIAFFVGSGTIDATYTLSDPIDVSHITGPLFQAVDNWPLSDVPVRRGVIWEFHPIAGTTWRAPFDGSSGAYHGAINNPTDGAIIAVASNQTYAHIAFSQNDRFADGSYALARFEARGEPLTTAYTVIASKSRVWNGSKMCQRVQILKRYPITSSEESCGKIGSDEESNAKFGVDVPRPALQSGELDFITDIFGGNPNPTNYRAMERDRLIYYEDPFFQTVPNPACCGTPFP